MTVRAVRSPCVRPDGTSPTICCRNAAGYGGLDFCIVAPSSSKDTALN